MLRKYYLQRVPVLRTVRHLRLRLAGLPIGDPTLPRDIFVLASTARGPKLFIKNLDRDELRGPVQLLSHPETIPMTCAARELQSPAASLPSPTPANAPRPAVASLENVALGNENHAHSPIDRPRTIEANSRYPSAPMSCDVQRPFPCVGVVDNGGPRNLARFLVYGVGSFPAIDRSPMIRARF